VARIILIHSDEQVRNYLVSLAGDRHQIQLAKELLSGLRKLTRAKPKPDAILIGHEAEQRDVLRLMRYLRDHPPLKVPVIVLLPRGEGAAQSTLSKAGVRVFLESPVDANRLDTAIVAAQRSRSAAPKGLPPVSPEEANSNLSLLENQLNKKMKCFAGKNQVFIQSMILGGRTSRPRIALKCRLRAEYGLNRDVYYEFIRDHCCGDPSQCEAYQRFNAERETA